MANSKRVTLGASNKDKFIIGGIFVALILGSLMGMYFPESAVKLEFLGSLFFNALYMIIVPLIAASMVVGITALGDVRKLGKTARHAVLYFMATSAVAVIIGIVLAVVIRPGEVGETASNQREQVESQYTIGAIGSLRAKAGEPISTVILAPDRSSALSISAENLPRGATIIDNGDGSARFEWRPGEYDVGGFQITFFVNDATRGVVSEDVTINVSDGKSLGFVGMLARIGDAMQRTLNEMIPRNIVSAAADTKVLALIVFSLLFGGALSSLGSRAKPVVQFFEVVNDTIMKIVHLVMYLAPLGVFGIVASKVGDKAGDIASAAAGIGLFSLVVLIGIAIHTGLLMGALRWLADRDPLPYMGNMSQALGTALGVSSSSATLPVTMECVVEKNNVDQRAASFVLPLGTTINMDGTAMYQAVSAIFVCQLFGVPLGIEHYVIMLVTAVLASVGTPGLPQAGIVMMSIVMGSVGVAPEIIAQGVGIILVVDWALDRARTALNVFGDSVGAAVIANTFEFKSTASGSTRTAPATQRREGRDSRGGRDSRSGGRGSRSEKPSRQSARAPRTREGARSESRADSRPERSVRRSESSSPEETKRVFAGMVTVPSFDMSRVPEGVQRRREAPAPSEADITPPEYLKSPAPEPETTGIQPSEYSAPEAAEELIADEPTEEFSREESALSSEAETRPGPEKEDTDSGEPKPAFGRGPRRR